MATKNNPPSATAEQTPTPENTPVPGGGRWRWDITAPGWVDVDAAPADAVIASEARQPMPPVPNPANPNQPE